MLQLEERSGATTSELLTPTATERIKRAFAQSQAAGLLHLASAEAQKSLPGGLTFARDFAQRYFNELCHLGDPMVASDTRLVAPPSEDELSALALAAPPMTGLEYLDSHSLRTAWIELDTATRKAIIEGGRGLRAYLHEKNPTWRLVGRVTFHLAENKRDEEFPFAFLATYATGVTERGSAQHLPLGRALEEFAGAGQRKRLIALLTPIQAAAERLPWVRELVEAGDIYHPLAWTPAEAHRFLHDLTALEASGLIVRIPNWWKPNRPIRPQVSVRIGGEPATVLGADSLLDFSVALTLDGESLTHDETRELLSSAGGLVRLRGQWVEADPTKLRAALEHWSRIERDASSGGISFYEGMRLLADSGEGVIAPAHIAESVREWSGVEPGDWLRSLLERIHNPGQGPDFSAQGLTATLRPYQVAGVKWLVLLTRLGLGACLADDMGLGKTIQVLALLLHRCSEDKRGEREPCLVVAPASLIANWKGEIERFAPDLSFIVAHPSELTIDLNDERQLETALTGLDLALTTYGMVARTPALRRRRWEVVVLDEAQAIKNARAQQTRAIKELLAGSRIALTGTPVENRLSDLWSLFDFLNPGLLGDARTFAAIAKRLAAHTERSYAPLRRLVQPYILRRLKTDRRIIADLPAKTEVRAFCALSREQAALYEGCVQELAEKLTHTEGIQRRGTVLAYLMQLKQICNHPAQWQGHGRYDPERSGKFQRLATLCEELAERQQRALVFTQFREVTAPLARHLGEVFGRPGIVLHGGIPVSKRSALIEDFQREEGPPFFVLSLKAGGVGLNLTCASQVIHFDRWWNPAVENQATDRAFRIGQQRNVVVHKFICRGTVEEKIDALIEAKVELARGILDVGADPLLTEMDNETLLATLALDIHKACDS